MKDALTFIAKFIESAGKGIKPYAKTILVALITNLQQKSSEIRAETIAAIDKIS